MPGDSHSEVVVESRRNGWAYVVFTFLMAAAITLGAAPFFEPEAIGTSVPIWAVVVLPLIAVWCAVGALMLLTERVIVTCSEFRVVNLFMDRSVPWSDVDELVAFSQVWFRCFVGVQRGRSAGRRGAMSVALAVQANYREVIEAMVAVARSPEYEGRIKISPLLLNELTKRGRK